MSPGDGSRVEFLGVPLDALTMDETVERCREIIEGRRPAQHVAINAGKVVLMQDQPRLREIVRDCDLVSADGWSVVWAARWLGLPVPERVAGIDLMERLLDVARKEEWPVFFLGAREEVLLRFEDRICRHFPGLRVAGRRNGYFSDDGAVAEEIAQSGARLLFVGISSPRKEAFLACQRETLGPMLAMGVGGSFDVWAGRTRRAPAWMQRSGLEWLYRFILEPRRMWRRYLVGNSRFILLILREMLSGERSRPKAGGSG